MKVLPQFSFLCAVTIGAALFTSACSAGPEPMVAADAGIPGDGATPGGADGSPSHGFDAERSYDGEGEACYFSVECGPRQICVDDTCIRHERVSPDDLELGDVRVRVAGEVANAALNDPLREWGTYLDTTESGFIRTWVQPGPDGDLARLILIDHPEACQVLVLHDDLQLYASDEVTCGTAALGPDGELIVGSERKYGERGPRGGMTSNPPTVALLDSAGEVLWEVEASDAVHQAVFSETGGTRTVGPASSFLHDGDRWLATFTLPRARVPATSPTDRAAPHLSTPHGHVGFVEIVPGSGKTQPLLVNGAFVQPLGRGWLLAGDEGPVAFMTSYDTSGDEDDLDWGATRTGIMQLETGAFTQFTEGYGFHARTVQHSEEGWLAQLYNWQTCRLEFVSLKESFSFENWRFLGRGCPGGEGYGLPTYVFGDPPHTLSTAAFVLHRRFYVGVVDTPPHRQPSLQLATREGAWTSLTIPGSSMTHRIMEGSAVSSRWGKTLEGLMARIGDLEWFEVALTRTAMEEE